MVKIAVLISGNGSNLQAIINAIQNKELELCIECVIADNPKAYGLERAKKAGITTHIVNRGKELSKNILPLVEGVDYIVLAGFLSILSSDFCNKWKNKIMNLHPSLLPKYGGKGMYGMYVHKAVLENNEKQSGVTVHWVTEHVDGGAIILQESCEINPNETPETLAEKIHKIEHKILIEALKSLLHL